MNRWKQEFAKEALRSATPPHLRRRRGRLLAALLARSATLDHRGYLSLCRSEGDPELVVLRLLPSWLGCGGLSRSGPRRWRYQLAHRRGLGELLALAAPAATRPAARKLLESLALRLAVPLPPLNPTLAAAAPHSIRRRPPPLTRWPAGWRRWGWGSCQLLLAPRPQGPVLEALWWQWLAGLIDGDGYLRVSGGGVELAIAGHWGEEPGVLAQVQRLVGYGAVRRSRRDGGETEGAVYQLTHPKPLKRVLGHCGPWLQNPKRRSQAAKVAAKLGEALPPRRVATAAWALGFLEADGSLTLCPLGQRWLLRLQASSTEETLMRVLAQVCGGHSNGPYVLEPPAKPKWTWQLGTDGPELQRLLQLWSRCPFGGPKGAKLPLVAEFLGLRRAKAYRKGSPHRGDWRSFRHR